MRSASPNTARSYAKHGHKHRYLTTEKTYRDFDLRFKFKSEAAGNSGLFFPRADHEYRPGARPGHRTNGRFLGPSKWKTCGLRRLTWRN